ncbi:MAG: hypothetical protein V4574_08245 [Pseudomonadota bacterium]
MSAAELPPLDDVLDLMVAEFGAPDARAVAAFSLRFPAHRAKLIDFAAAWAAQSHLPVPEPLSAVREGRIADRAQRALDEGLAARAAARRPKSLAELAALSGQDLDQVARVASLDQSLVRKLDGRRIDPRSIPGTLTARLAAILRTDPAIVAQSWAEAPSAMPAMAAFIAIDLPLPVSGREDFAAAVAASSLSAAQKAALLSGE